MNTLEAMMRGAANRNKEQMIFDWDHAAKAIKEMNPVYADAGLDGDFEYTGGCIYSEEKPVTNSYTYLASTWATPVLVLYGCGNPSNPHDRDPITIECYVMKHETNWTEKTKWPESALKILKEK